MNVCTVHSFANIISILPFFTPIFFSQGLSNDSRPSRSDTKANARKNRAGGNNKNQGGQSRPKAGPGAPLPAVPGKYLHSTYTPFQIWLLFKLWYIKVGFDRISNWNSNKKRGSRLPLRISLLEFLKQTGSAILYSKHFFSYSQHWIQQQGQFWEYLQWSNLTRGKKSNDATTISKSPRQSL